MRDDVSDSVADRELGEIVDHVTRMLQAGIEVDPDSLATQFPQFPKYADELRQLLPALKLLASERPAAPHERLSEDPGHPLRAQSAADPIRVLGDFRLLREIGRGAMGVIYEADQISLSKRVAVKVLPFASMLDERRLQRFRNESQAAASLEHPNIVPAYAVGCERGVHFYAMKYVEGQDVKQLIKDLRRGHNQTGYAPKAKSPPAPSDASTESLGGSPALIPSVSVGHASLSGTSRSVSEAETATDPIAALSTERATKTKAYLRSAAALAIQAADALQYAHEMGVIHRDIKPSNLLLDTRGNLWITDFGLAQVQNSPGVTMPGDLLGTLRYMSPEQALAKRVLVDARTDVYSLGVTFYELLTLEQAFPGKDREEVFRQIAFEEPVAPRKINAQIPGELETIVLKTMANNPAERYQSAGELADDLRRFLADEPIRARRPTIVQRVVKWSRRHRPMAWSAAMATTVIFLGFVFATVIIAAAWQSEKELRLRLERELVRSQSLRLCAESSAVLDENPGLAVLLAIEAAKLEPSLLANNALLAALDENHEHKTLIGHTREVGWLDFSPDGRRVVTATVPGPGAANEPAIIWNVETGEQLAKLSNGSVVTSAVFSPDGQIVLGTSSPYVDFRFRRNRMSNVDATPRLWDAGSGNMLKRLEGGYLPRAGRHCFSSQMPWLVAPGADNTVRIFDYLTGSEIIVLRGHDDRVVFAAFSPHGHRVVSFSDDQTVRVWEIDQELRSGKEMARLDWLKRLPIENGDRSHAIHSAEFSPEGKKLLITSSDYGPKLWDLESQTDVTPDRWTASVVVFSPDGTKMLSYSVGSGLRKVEVRDSATGEILSTFDGHNGAIYAAAFSRDGTRIVTASADKTVRVWETVGAAQVAILKGHQREVRFAAFSPEGLRVVSTSSDKTARVWNVESGKELGTVVRDSPLKMARPQRFIQSSPDGERLLTVAGPENHTAVWDIELGKEVHSFEGASANVTPSGRVATFSQDVSIWDVMQGESISRFRSPEGSLRDARLSPDGARILAIADTGEVWIWHVASRTRLLLKGHRGLVYCAEFSPKGELAVTGAADSKACLWDTETGTLLRELPHERRVVDAKFSANGDRLVTTTDDDVANVWDVRTGTPVATLSAEGARFDRAKLTRLGTRLLTYHTLHTDAVRVWDVQERKVTVRIGGPTGRVHSSALSPDEETLLVASETESGVWDASSGEKLLALGTISSAAFSPDGKWIVTASSHKAVDLHGVLPPKQWPSHTLAIWDARSGEQLRTLAARTGNTTDVMFSPDSKHLVVERRSYGADVRNLQSRQRITRFRRHAGKISHLSFSPDGKHALTASWDGTARVWDAASGKELALLKGHKQAILDASFSPDGNRIATVSADKTGRIWDAATGTQLAVLKGELNQVSFVVFSPDSHRILTLSLDKMAQIWAVDTGKPLVEIPSGTEGHIIYAEFERNGSGLLTVHGPAVSVTDRAFATSPVKDYIVRLWGPVGSEPRDLKHTGAVLVARFSPDGQRILSVGDGAAHLWDRSTGEQPLRTLEIKGSPVQAAFFSHSGERVVSFHPKTVTLWNARDGAQLTTISDRRGFNYGAIGPRSARIWPPIKPFSPFSTDGSWLTTVSREGKIRMTTTNPLATAIEARPRELTVEERRRFAQRLVQ